METILQRLTELDEITGAILVGKDGLIVSGALHSEDEEMLGAMSEAIFGSISDYTAQINNGDLHHVIIETSTGTVQFAEVGELILVVTTSPSSNLGRVRLEITKACRQLSRAVTAY